jgi:uncharacterized membrane protein required for colicin V production
MIMHLANITFNWFDLVAAGALLLGAVFGRKKGLSEELLPLFQWLAVVVVGALYYEPIGRFLAGYTQLSLLVAYVLSYIAIIAFHMLLFNFVKRAVGDKLVSSDVFGRYEYLLGMGAGFLKAAALILVFLALMNAKFVDPEKVAAMAKSQQENFGSISFPTFGTVQNAVLRESSVGQFAGRHFKEQLIKATDPGDRLVYRKSLGSQREEAVQKVVDGQ